MSPLKENYLLSLRELISACASKLQIEHDFTSEELNAKC